MVVVQFLAEHKPFFVTILVFNVTYLQRKVFALKDCNTTADCYLRFSLLLINPLKPELNPICYLLSLLGAHHLFHVSRIRVKLLTLR